MVRFAFAGLAMLTFAGAAAAEEDKGGQRPALPSELERIALGAGFVSRGSPITADMESGPRIDILYSAILMKRGEKFSLIAYIEGPPDGPTVSCGLSTVGVSAEALPDLIEKLLNARDRTEKAPADDKRLQASWRVGAPDDGATLEVSAWRDPPRRASIGLTYRGRGH